jgi:hypothetical protein
MIPSDAITATLIWSIVLMAIATLTGFAAVGWALLSGRRARADRASAATRPAPARPVSRGVPIHR